ncbi:MAG: hypothetical protein U0Q22_11525 [Acidimicrobiales bacterium]
MASSRPAPVLIDHDAAELAAVMDELAATGRGWINLLPEIPEDVPVPSTPNALAIFSKRGPVVPLGTWTAPTAARNGAVAPSEIGIQHGAAKQAARALADGPAAVPGDWFVLSDNPRRGFVVRPPASTTTLAQASWLLDALAAICIPPQTGRFQMFRYDG